MQRAPCISGAGKAGRIKRCRKIATSRFRCYADRPDRHAGHGQGQAAGGKLQAKDPRIVQVMAGLAAEYVVMVARADAGRRRARWCA
jgi:hypothetical protein